MPGQKPFVVGTDGSKHAQAAVRWAAQHASRHGAPLLIATAASAPVAYGMGGHLPQDFFDQLKEEGTRIIAESIEIAKEAAPDVDVDGKVFVDATGPALLDLSQNADLIVVGTRGLSGIASAFMGSVSSLIARHSACPVVVVRTAAADGSLPASGPVVIGLDGSENSVPALEAAMKEASLRGATLIAVHAWSDLPLSTMDPITQVGALYDEATIADTIVAERLAGFSEQYPDVNVEHRVVMDHPDVAIVEAAKGAQLVVVGSRGRGGITGLLLGSTSIKVLRHAECPVMVVHK